MANKEKFFDIEKGNAETKKYLEGKWKDIFSTNPEKEAEVKAMSEGEQNFKALMDAMNTPKPKEVANKPGPKPKKAAETPVETEKTE